MKKEVLITEYQSKLLLSKWSDQRVIEFSLEDEQKRRLNSIYVGKVRDISENMQAAFVEISPGVVCYLPLEECDQIIFTKERNSKRKLVCGDELIIQITEDARKTKSLTGSAVISLYGQNMVVSTQKGLIGVSKKIEKNRAEQLRTFMEDIAEDRFGVIVRTNAQNVDLAYLEEEYKELVEKLAKILTEARYRTCYTVLSASEPAYIEYLRTLNLDEEWEIRTDLSEVFKTLSEYIESIHLQNIKLSLHTDSLISLSALRNIQKELERALHKKVWMKSGAYLVIEPTEALTVIDVNTGKYTSKKKDKQQSILEINLEAADEIGRQIRLRNISGIIIIDFINLSSKENRIRLCEHMKAIIQTDPVPTKFIDMTKLDLVELTRKKVKKSLAEQMVISS